MPKTDKDFEFKVYNLGNQYDFMKVGISENSRESLEDAGFNINIPISKVNVEPMVAPAKVRIQIRTPKTQGWTDAYHTLDFYAESDFSCKNGGCDRESQMITIYVRGIYLPGFEIIPALSMVALAAADLQDGVSSTPMMKRKSGVKPPLVCNPQTKSKAIPVRVGFITYPCEGSMS